MQTPNLYQSMIQKYALDIVCPNCNGNSFLATRTTERIGKEIIVTNSVEVCKSCHGNGVNRKVLLGAD